MPRIIADWNGNRLALGGLLMAVGAALLAFLPGLSDLLGLVRAELILFPINGLLLVLGVVVAVRGSVSIAPKPSIHRDRWDSSEVLRALRQAGDFDTIRILNTWIPDVEEFTAHLQDLLIGRGKRFQIKVLLMKANPPNEEQPELLIARVRHRNIPPELAAVHILHTKDQIISLKEQVDEHWSRKLDGRTLDLQIRTYDHLPFGPLYQIGERVIYTGFFLSYAGSGTASPMLKITKSPAGVNGHGDANRMWSIFAEQMSRAWEKGTI